MNQKGGHNFGHTHLYENFGFGCKLLKIVEAAIGIEPMNKGFAEIRNPKSQSYTEC